MARDVRELLRQVGIGDTNATQVITTTFKTPANIDAGMPAVIILSEAIQRTLNQCGAGLEVDGVLRGPTIVELRKVIGRMWPATPFYEIIDRLVRFREQGGRLVPGLPSQQGGPTPGGGLGLSLPDAPFPGGTPGFLIAAGALAWWFLKEKPRRELAKKAPPAEPRRTSSPTARTIRKGR